MIMRLSPLPWEAVSTCSIIIIKYNFTRFLLLPDNFSMQDPKTSTPSILQAISINLTAKCFFSLDRDNKRQDTH